MNNIIIYKIYCKNEEIKDCYIGSTSNIKNRIYLHKSDCNNENAKKKYNQYIYIYIRENGGWDNWEYKIICECPKEDRYEMERWHIENCKESNLNKCIPNRTIKDYNKEYYEKNKDKIKKYKKEYHQKNKELINKKHKEYREKKKQIIEEKRKQKMTCICGSVFRIDSKIRHCKRKKHQNYIKQKNII